MMRKTLIETTMKTDTASQVSNILLIDDNSENLLGLECILEQDNRKFYKSLSGYKGVDLARKHDISLILLDVQMPEINGFEVAELLQNDDATKHIPIIFITAMSRNLKYALKGFSEGAVDYLSKPVNPDFLRAKVEVFLKLEKQRREILHQYQQLEKLGLMVENSIDIMAILDQRTLAFEEINPAFTEILEYRAGDIIGQKITQLFCHLRDVIRFEKELLNFTKKGSQKLHFEIKANTKQGEEKWLSINVGARMNKWFLNARDITRNKNLEFKLIQSNEDLQQFAQMVAYELKDPVNMVDQYIRMLKEGGTPEETSQYTTYLTENIPGIKKLMDDLLYYARTSEDIIYESISFTALLEKVIKSLEPAIRESGAEIKVGKLPEINCLPLQIEMVFRNMIKNAIRFCEGKKPTIEIQCVEKHDYWEFSIHDNGVGMNRKYAQMLFGNFEGAIMLNKPRIRGIGLKICDKIVKRHGGKIYVDSSPGEGSVFYFTIKKGKCQ